MKHLFSDNYDLHTQCHITKINTTAQINNKNKFKSKNRKQNVVLRSVTKFGTRTHTNKSVCEDG